MSTCAEAQEIKAHWRFSIMYPLKNLQQRTLQHGTTTACYFATIHLEATKELCKAAGKFKNQWHGSQESHSHVLNTCSATYGQRALVGIVSMDYQKKSPEFYRENTKQSLQSTRRYEQSSITSHRDWYWNLYGQLVLKLIGMIYEHLDKIQML